MPCSSAVSEPNLKLRYKPKKSLERRKNPLLRKESAPPSLRRRPAETLGGRVQSGRGVALPLPVVFFLWVRFRPDGSCHVGLLSVVQGVAHTPAWERAR